MFSSRGNDQRRSGRATIEARKRRRMQPTLLALEDRKLLSTIVVNNPTDTPVVGLIDLRQAIVQANTNGGVETITFDKTVFKTPQTINLTGGQLELSDTTGTETITGPTAGVTVNAGGLEPGVRGRSGCHGVDLGNDHHRRQRPGVGDFSGGGLANYGGTTTLTNCTVSGNSADVAGGGLYTNSAGTTTLTNCTVSGNSALARRRPVHLLRRHDDADELHRQRQLRRRTARRRSVQRRHGHVDELHRQRQLRRLRGGGLINAFGAITLTNCTVSGNSAGERGGGVSNRGSLHGRGQHLRRESRRLRGSDLQPTDIQHAPAHIDLLDSGFTGNSAGNTGGAVSNSSGSGSISGCQLLGQPRRQHRRGRHLRLCRRIDDRQHHNCR